MDTKKIARKDIRYSLWVSRLLFAALAAYSIYIFKREPIELSKDIELLALAVVWASLLPTFIYLRSRNKSPVPFMPFIGIFYALGYGFPVFYAYDIDMAAPHDARFFMRDINPEALILTIAGILLMQFTFYISKAWIWKNIKGLRLPGG